MKNYSLNCYECFVGCEISTITTKKHIFKRNEKMMIIIIYSIETILFTFGHRQTLGFQRKQTVVTIICDKEGSDVIAKVSPDKNIKYIYFLLFSFYSYDLKTQTMTKYLSPICFRFADRFRSHLSKLNRSLIFEIEDRKTLKIN